MQSRLSAPFTVFTFRQLTAVLSKSALLFYSATILAFGQISAIPATPYISPASGTYTSSRTVTISDATAGTTIYYTTNGSAPTTASPRYTGSFSTPSSPAKETVRAFAVRNGIYSSDTSATYTIAPPLGAPAFSLAQGSYMSAQSVTISAPSPGKVIHYTTNGTAPTASSAVYNGKPITVTGRTTIAAMVAPVSGYAASATASQTYSIIPATPFISPASGTYTTGRTVTISDATAGTTIYYTTNGSAPTTSSPRYTGPITIPTSPIKETIRAFAVASGVYSSATSAAYTIAPLLPVPTPVISPASGTYLTNKPVTISNSLLGASIFYTTDGSIPTASSTRYSGPFFFANAGTGTKVVKAIAFKTGYLTSSISQSNINLSLPAGAIATTILSADTPVATIATNFLGFSHEWGTAQTMMGSTSLGVNNIYRKLVGTLTSNMDGPLSIRIGGDSTDTTGNATAATVEPFAELSKTSDVKFILGVNLGSNNLSLAEEQAKAYISGLPTSVLAAIEIGNEPDGYSANRLRPSTYTYAEFMPQYQEWEKGIAALSTPAVKIGGPTFGTGNWIPSAQPDVANSTLKAGIITQHKYLSCYDASSPLPWNILLQPSSSTDSLWLFQPYVAAAHQVNSSFRMDEMNSICGGGQPGVSNTFSSALWAIDTMFEYANIGVDGVNWNTNSDGGAYDLFQFSVWNNGHENLYSLTAVRPLYYGLLLFAEAAGKTAQLLPTSTLTNANVKVWVTKDSTGRAHLVVINKEQSISGTVQVTLPGYTSGSIVRLAASSYLATSGITIAGQTYDGSPDGTLQGSSVTETISPTSSGVWTIPVSAMSAVAVTLEP
jgi:Chitobiase/beta-hexosaminidase C-terminal domain/Glycosyl hydrolase family 79 C-terminal beta domain